jgi:hypothetical protein
MQVTQSLLWHNNERQCSINNLWLCILDHPRAIQQHGPAITVLPTMIGKNAGDDITTTS